MKVQTDINRVTLKKKDGLIFVIESPEVLKNEHTWAIFGELKIADLNNQNIIENQTKKYATPATKVAAT